jgi:hypothetical protein
MFFNRQPKESPDELANRLQKEGRIDQLEKELQRYSPGKLGAKDRESYYHLWGIAALQRGDRAIAFDRFKEGQKYCSESAPIRFSLGQEHEARGEIGEMLACFDGCTFPAVSSHHMLVAARYAYLWGHPAKGVAYLKPIADAYFQLGIADDHFVYVRGLPFFGLTWSYLVAFAWMQASYEATDEFLSRSKATLSDYDFDRLGRFYEAHKRSDYSEYAAELAKDLETRDARFPSGYQRVQLSALKAVNGIDPDAAVAALQSIELAESDFPWLRDVILLHTARCYWRAGRPDEETVERARFLDRQKLLFEPDHAFGFAFLDYQEELRPVYQSTRGEQGGAGNGAPLRA